MPDKFAAAPAATQDLILELIDALTRPIEGLGARFNEDRVLTGAILADLGYVTESAPTPTLAPTPEPTSPPVTDAPVIDTPPTT